MWQYSWDWGFTVSIIHIFRFFKNSFIDNSKRWRRLNYIPNYMIVFSSCHLKAIHLYYCSGADSCTMWCGDHASCTMFVVYYISVILVCVQCSQWWSFEALFPAVFTVLASHFKCEFFAWRSVYTEILTLSSIKVCSIPPCIVLCLYTACINYATDHYNYLLLSVVGI